jgi:hypothetical protein
MLIEPHRANPNLHRVCFVVRTYSKHLDASSLFNLPGFLDSLENLEYTNWLAILVNTDGGDRHASSIISAYVEERANFKVTMQRVPNALLRDFWSDESGYIVTDWAIRQCPNDTEWLIVTNGDNQYEPNSLNWVSAVLRNNVNADIIRMPFYSRYIHGDAAAQDRDADRPSDWICKESLSSSGSSSLIDVSAIALRYRKVLLHDVYFSQFWPEWSIGQDNALYAHLQNNGWTVYNASRSQEPVHVMHNPNVVSCKKAGGIWFASPLFDEFACFSHDQFYNQMVDAHHNRRRGTLAGSPVYVAANCAVYSTITTLTFTEQWLATKPSLQSASLHHTQEIARQLLEKSNFCGFSFDWLFYSENSCPECLRENAADHWALHGFRRSLKYRFTTTDTGDGKKTMRRERIRKAAHGSGLLGNEDVGVCFLFYTVAGKHI